MKERLKEWLEAERVASDIHNQLVALQLKHGEAVHKVNQIVAKITEEMKSNGVVEEKIEGSDIDFVIHFTTPRTSVKVENPDSVPDEFVKIERKPMLREIEKHLKTNQVNWATLQRGVGKLTYKAVKKGAQNG